jgi:hypothetical protein
VDHADADAQRLDLGDEHRGEVGAADRAHAADHHHDEGVADHDQVEAEIGGLARELQRAAERGEERAAREHGGEQQRLVDAERADHLAVLRRGADQPAKAGLGEQEMQAEEHDRPGRDQEDVIAREPPVEELDRAAQPRRARPEQVLVAPDEQRGVVDHQQDREGRQQLEQLGRLVDAAQQQDLDQRADRGDRERRDEETAPKAEPAADLGRDAVGDVDAQHVERAVGDVDDAGDAEDQRQSGTDEEQSGRGREPVERLEQEGVEGHRAIEPPGDLYSVTLRCSPLLGRASKGDGHDPASRRASLHIGAVHPSRPAKTRAPQDDGSKIPRVAPQSAAGRSFFTSAAEGSTLAPSTYLKSAIVPLPFLSAILPT